MEFFSCWTEFDPSNQRKSTEFFDYRMIKNGANLQ